MKLENRNVVSGLEGCGKSSKVFKSVEKEATVEKPVLFGVKNYRLMSEQINNWSSRFNIPLEQFAICGFNLDYEPAREVYTDKQYPFMISDKVRFVFTSQALIQRGKHLEFGSFATGKPVEYSHIVIDEFDFASGIIPSLDYQLNNLKVDRGEIEKRLSQWLKETYTIKDYVKVMIKKRNGDKGFTLAYWIESCKCPLTFLTSERLATRLLKLLGFNEVYIESPDFTDYTINIWEYKYLNRTFFAKMNQYVGWNKIHNELGYELIISDCINSYYEANQDNTLDVSVISHISIRGSNDWRNRKILTVLSYIPQQVICEILDAFNYYNDPIEYKEVEKLFYRDRLCQAVGRVLGNRGSKETDLLISSSLLNKIKEYDEIPYTLNTDWQFEFKGLDAILQKVEEAEEKIKENTKKKYSHQSMTNYSILDQLFIKEENSYILVSELKDYLTKNGIVTNKGKSTLSATKVASYFNAQIKNKRINNILHRVVFGITKLY